MARASVLLSKDLTWTKPTPLPMAIVQAASEADAALAVPVLAQLEKQYGIIFRVRPGGHHYDVWKLRRKWSRAGSWHQTQRDAFVP
jgi:hypothetical protein